MLGDMGRLTCDLGRLRWLSCRRKGIVTLSGVRHVFLGVSGAWRPCALNRRCFFLLSPDVAPPDWMTVFLLSVHFPIALNVMGINIQWFQQTFHLCPQTDSNFKIHLHLFSKSPFYVHLPECSCNMSTSSKPISTKKRQSKPKNPPGLNQAMINWKEEKLHNLIQNFKFPYD
ncbi:hypothetical protein Hanom_Chr07g00621031 [Helianthus anomalus]